MIDHRLQVLDAVQRHGTVTAAAEALHLTPSAVSHQLRALARELELTLLEPAGRNVRLTSAAHTLLAHADVLFAQWENARADLAAHWSGGLSGPLRLCGFSTAAAAFVPPAAARLREAYPQLSLEIIETEPGPAFDLLVSGQADIAVVVATPGIPPATDARFDQQRLYDEPSTFWSPPATPTPTVGPSPCTTPPPTPGSWAPRVALTTTWSCSPARLPASLRPLRTTQTNGTLALLWSPKASASPCYPAWLISPSTIAPCAYRCTANRPPRVTSSPLPAPEAAISQPSPPA